MSFLCRTKKKFQNVAIKYYSVLKEDLFSFNSEKRREKSFLMWISAF